MDGRPPNFGFNANQNVGYPPYESDLVPGYPPQHQPGPGYPNQPGSNFPNQSSYGQNQGYGSGYPPGPDYPSLTNPGYSPPNMGYPLQHRPGLPPQNPNPGYPMQPTVYPPQDQGYPLLSRPDYQNDSRPSPVYPPQGQGYPLSSRQDYQNDPRPPYVPYTGAPPTMPGYQPQSNQPYTQQSYGNQQQGYPQQQQQGGSYQSPNYGHQNNAPPLVSTNPSLRPSTNFNANGDADTLRKAMKGFGTNNQKVIQVICARTNRERQEIAKTFRVMYGKDLISDLKSELSGDFEDLILALMEPTPIYDAKQLRRAMEGFGTKESVLIEIMCSRTNNQIQEVRQAYRQLYGNDLERELIGESSGHFKRLLISLCAGGRDESNRTDPLKANQDAQALYRAGEQRLGTDESTFNAILAAQNYAQLRLVFDEYQKITRHSIEQSINAEFSSDIRDGLLAIVKCIKNRPAFFAELIYNSLRGFGTRDTDLIRVIVSRADIDLRDVRTEYQKMYKTSLENAIAGDCSGNYKEGLIALVKGNY